MSKVERDIGQGQSQTAAEGLVPVGLSGELNPGSLDPEALDPASLEVRFGNPEVDAPRLLKLFTESTVVEHLEGIVPFPYIEEIIDPDTGKVRQREVPATTEDDIRNMYKNPSVTLLVVGTTSGIIVGTCTVGKKSSNVAEIGRLVVDKRYRNERIANKLIRAANAFIFSKHEGLDCKFAEAFVIINVDGYHTAQDVFANVYKDEFVRGKGYLRAAERELTTRSWSNEEGGLVDRNSQPMTLTRSRYIENFPGDHIESFPKTRPPKAE